jgi:hypothetical protein
MREGDVAPEAGGDARDWFPMVALAKFVAPRQHDGESELVCPGDVGDTCHPFAGHQACL